MTSTNREAIYKTSQETYTSADILRMHFNGATPDPKEFAQGSPPAAVQPMRLTVIDGEARQVLEQRPPNSEIPAGHLRLLTRR